MKKNTKSSITLPPQELELVEHLLRTLGAKSKVDVVRKGLLLLKEKTDRDFLKNAYREASLKTRLPLEEELRELDPLSDEGLHAW